MDIETARALVTPFYTALNAPGTKDVAALITSVATEDWRSQAGPGVSKSRAEFIVQVIGFGKFIPDLSWDIQEVLPSGDRIVVRSIARGTPAGPFMGAPHTGRSFTIVAIDIHTVRDGKLVDAWHVEDWMTATRQLAG